MFTELQEIHRRPKPFEVCTVADLWTDEHISKKMLELHLDPHSAQASRTEEFVDKSAAWIAARGGVGEGTRICDFGCGPGLYTTRWAEMGAAVTGVDFSPRSIEHARNASEQQGLSVDYILQNYLEFSSNKKFDLITMIFVDLCALGPDQRAVMFRKFHDHLEDGGVAVLDVLSLVHFDAVSETSDFEFFARDGFWSPDPCFVFLNAFKYEQEKVLLYKHTVIEENRTRVIYNWLQCFSLESLHAEMESCGLRIDGYYSDVAGTPFDPASGEFAVVASKL